MVHRLLDRTASLGQLTIRDRPLGDTVGDRLAQPIEGEFVQFGDDRLESIRELAGATHAV